MPELGGASPLNRNSAEAEDIHDAALSPASIARRRFLLESGALTGLATAPYFAALTPTAEAETGGSPSGAISVTQVQLTVNGRRVNSCLTLALSLDGKRVVTVEGLGSTDNLHPIQAAFLEHDAFQCGYCTPGQICSAVALFEEARNGAASAATGDVRRLEPVKLSDEEIRERMSGNLCRCGAYVNIVAAIRDVAARSG
jgi:aerobic-type carbon monoxide dehydrogenase small subunit (CoxS/CutS family)